MKLEHILLYLLVLVCVSNALSSDEVTKAKKEEEIHLRQTYADMDKGIKNLVRNGLKSGMQVLAKQMQEFNISTKCQRNAFKILLGLRDLKFWALNFIDATGKLSDGALTGNANMFGHYDQCLNSTVLKKSGAVDFRGQYCLVSFSMYGPKQTLTPDLRERVAVVKKLTQNLTEAIGLYAFRSEALNRVKDKVGLCVPSGCDVNDITQIVKYVGKIVLMNITLDYCDTEESLRYFTTTRIIILSIYALFVFVAIVGSGIERYSIARKIQYKNPVIRSLVCFSLPYNFMKLTNTKVTERNLSFLNGIKVLALFYIILGHHYLIKMEINMQRNLLFFVLVTVPRLSFQVVVSGLFSVDVFFFIGGFLNCYTRVKKNLNYFSFRSSFMLLVHKLMRIYPAYIFAILLGYLLNPRGPMSREAMDHVIKPCKTEWWKNLLFINNFFPPAEQCAAHSWYLAADMHYFVVSLVTIPTLLRNPKIGIMMNLGVILLLTIISAVRSWNERLPPSPLLNVDSTEQDIEDMLNFHFSSFPHASAYFGGVLLGYYVATKEKFTISKMTQVFGWIVSSTLFLTMTFISKKWYSGHPYTRLESALYGSLSKLIYSWSVGWLIFCCFTGHGGFVNRILSMKLWIPLSRLALSGYLVSLLLQFYYFGNLRSPQDFQDEIEIWNYLGEIVVTYLMSIPMVLLFESPFIALEKVIFPQKEKTSEFKENEMNVKHENDTKL